MVTDAVAVQELRSRWHLAVAVQLSEQGVREVAIFRPSPVSPALWATFTSRETSNRLAEAEAASAALDHLFGSENADRRLVFVP